LQSSISEKTKTWLVVISWHLHSVNDYSGLSRATRRHTCLPRSSCADHSWWLCNSRVVWVGEVRGFRGLWPAVKWSEVEDNSTIVVYSEWAFESPCSQRRLNWYSRWHTIVHSPLPPQRIHWKNQCVFEGQKHPFALEWWNTVSRKLQWQQFLN
jgi:hypothetical protein